MRKTSIAGVQIGDEFPPYFIAEIGHNHMGELDKALLMVELAAKAGVQAVKFQKRDNRALFTKEMYESPYVNDNSYGDTYGAHREALEFGNWEYLELAKEAERWNIVMFATPFDFQSANFLQDMGVPAFKIASGDLLNTPLIRYVARFGKPIIISTGGGTLEDVKRAHDAAAGRTDVILLQCTASYPCKPEDMNLRVIETYREEFPDAVIGLSDHQDGIALGPAAYALGARVFEKHFTFDHSARGTDHAFSLEPGGLAKYVGDISRTGVALGTGEKRPLPVELKPLYKMGKGLYAARNLKAGTLLQERDFVIKSPVGVPPYRICELSGKILLRDIPQDGALKEGDWE